MTGPKVGVVDIETLPAVVEAWGLHKQFINIEQIREPSKTLGFGFKWRGDKSVTWVDIFNDGPEQVAACAWAFFDTADVVVTWNGDRFDIPTLRRDILLAGMVPPSPFKSIDLWRHCKSKYNFLSTKLDYVAQQLGLGKKAETGGYELWQLCAQGDAAALRKMAKYCKQDVLLTEATLEKFLPDIKGWPNVALWSEASGHVCPRCDSGNVQRRGEQVALAIRYQRFQCQDCGAWSRSAKGESIGSDLRAI